jgi:hypothetical protein
LGLNPGDTYRLVFVTSASTDATSGDIDYYNAFVTTAADDVPELAALAATWFDIGTTEAVSAINNIGIDSGVPIYDLEGNLIANDAGTEAGGMFSGSIQNPLIFNEVGAAFIGHGVWTGTAANGQSADGGELGSGSPVIGCTGSLGPSWIYCRSEIATQGEFPLYAISGVLTPPVSTSPEPATTGMVIAAGALMFFAGRRNRRPL